jgi:uncharacterized protein (TIGR02246 family)
MEPSPAETSAIEAVVRGLQEAWNEGDYTAFAAGFMPDADFVNIYGRHFRGRDSIAVRHAHIFRTFFAGSVIAYTIAAARLLRPDVALVHLRMRLHVPQEPANSELEASPSLVLTCEDGQWRIAAFHNTLITSGR